MGAKYGVCTARVLLLLIMPVDLQRLCDCYLGTLCDLLPSIPRKMLLAELGLLPLQVFW